MVCIVDRADISVIEGHHDVYCGEGHHVYCVYCVW